MGLIDVWRFYNPSTRDYTHFSSPHTSYSRIDYFFVFGRDLNKMSGCHIGNMDLSDHCPVYLTVTEDRRNKSGLWRLNSSILTNDRIEQFSSDILNYVKDNDNGEVSPPILWDACKAVMRGKAIAATSFLKKQRAKSLSNLQFQLKKLESEHKRTLNLATEMELKRLEIKLTNYLDQRYKRI